MSETHRGVVTDGAIVLRGESMPWANGTEVLVIPVVDSPGSASAILKAMEATLRVPSEWVDELEQLIGQGSRPL